MVKKLEREKLELQRQQKPEREKLEQQRLESIKEYEKKLLLNKLQTPTFSDEETEVDTNDETETESDEEDTIFL